MVSGGAFFMKDYINDIFYDTLLSLVTKKYGTALNDSQREDKVKELVEEVVSEHRIIVHLTQLLIDKLGFNDSYTTNINGQSVYALVKEGMFKKVKLCYFITRKKDSFDIKYLEQVYNELTRQSKGENVFGAKEYKNG